MNAEIFYLLYWLMYSISYTTAVILSNRNMNLNVVDGAQLVN